MSFWGGQDDMLTGGGDSSALSPYAPWPMLPSGPSSSGPALPPSFPVASAPSMTPGSIAGSLGVSPLGMGGPGSGASAFTPFGMGGPMGGPGSPFGGASAFTPPFGMDPMTLAAILHGLGLGGTGMGGGGSGGSGPLSIGPFGSGGTGLLGGLLGPLGGSGSGGSGALGSVGSGLGIANNLFSGINSFSSGQYGGGIGNLLGSLVGAYFGGPGGSALGGQAGNLIGSLFQNLVAPPGLPKFNKPQGYASALRGSGDPLEAMLGNYIQKYGINRGYTLSEPWGGPAPFNPSQMGDVLQYLSGQQFSGLRDRQLTAAGQMGYQHPVTLGMKNLQELNAMEGGPSRALTLSQLQSIMPEMATLLGRSAPGHDLSGLLGQENELAQKLRMAETY